MTEDKTEVDEAIEAGGNWFVVCPSTMGTKDKFQGAREGGHGHDPGHDEGTQKSGGGGLNSRVHGPYANQ